MTIDATFKEKPNDKKNNEPLTVVWQYGGFWA